MTASEGLTKHQTTVGVFNDRAAADLAVDALKRVGFRDDQIGSVSGRLGPLGRLGLTDHQTNYFRAELAAGHTVVTVQSQERYLEADAILRRHGAYVYSGPYPAL